MEFSLDHQTVALSVGEFAAFSLGPQESSGVGQGIWRAQLGQHWHNELRARTEKESTTDGIVRADLRFEVPLEGRLVHRGWTFSLNGRIDQLVGSTVREIKSVMRPLPAAEPELRADYPDYFRQLAAYLVLLRTIELPELPDLARSALRGELIFVEAGSGLAQTIALTSFDEAIVFHQLDALVDFLNLRRRATERRRSLAFRPAFHALRQGQENIQRELLAASASAPIVLFEAPTGYGKTGCLLEFALGQLRSGKYARLIWLTGKSTGQIQVVHTLEQMTTLPSEPGAGSRGALASWQVRNKSEHCVNHTFHCVRDACGYLAGCAERWPQSGLAKFYLDDAQPHDLETLRTAGREARICPYEITRASLAFNDVWIGDFNYIFAPDNRGLFFSQPGFDARETLLIVDEAHNLPSRVAGAYSHRATSDAARLLLAELDHLQAPGPLVRALEDWTQLLGSLRPAESLDPNVEDDVRELVRKLAELVTSSPLDYVALGPTHSAELWQFSALAAFLDDTKLTKLLWVARGGELEFTCVDAAAAIGETLAEFGGAMLMSATLQPFGEFAVSCGLVPAAAPAKSSASPVSGRDRASSAFTTLTALTPWRAGAYEVAVDLRVDTSFRQRASHHGTTAATVEALHAAASANRSTGTTAAIAVFFPSYAYADTIWRELERRGSVLRVAMQPRLPDLTAQAAWIEENLAFSDTLFLVLGSSFAEGIDLLGGRISHAMVVGPALPEVNAVQKARAAAFSALGRETAFRRVYQIPGLQKVNQALGRLVRAPGQRTRVLLHCQRFAEPSYAALLAMDYQLYTEIPTDQTLQDWLAPAQP